MKPFENASQRGLQAQALIREIRQKGAVLSLKEQSQLHLSAPKGLLGSETLKALQELKSELSGLLLHERRAEILAQPELQEGPLSSIQSRLWFVQALNPSGSDLNLIGACRIFHDLDRPRIHQAIEAVSKRQPALRTSFYARDGKLFQHCHPQLALPFEAYSLLGSADPLPAIQSWALQPFNLEAGPLCRWGWFATETGGILAWSLHHLIADGWSTGLLLGEILAAYQGIPLPELKYSLLDHARWEQADQNPLRIQAGLEFWLKQLEGIPLEFQLPGETEPEIHGPAEVSVALPAEIGAALEALAKNAGVTPFVLSLALWQILLSIYGQCTQFVMGIPVSSRNQPEWEGLIGCFINTLLLPVDLEPDSSFQNYLTRLQASFHGQMLWQDLPFEKLVHALNRSTHPLPELYFVYQNNPLPLEQLPWKVEWLDLPQQAPPFPLTLTVEPGNGRLKLSSSQSSISPALLRQMLRHYLYLAEQIIDNPQHKLSELRSLSQTEISEVFQKTVPQKMFEPLSWIHQHVEKHAETQAEKTALRWQGQEISYRELNQKANALAQIFAEKGMRAGDRIAIWVPVAPVAIAALIAILKLGAAYLPLDQDAPKERIEKILRHARPSILLSEPKLLNPEDGAEELFNQFTCLNLPAWETLSELNVNPETPVSGDDLAYMIFTSGSTGEPNGVEITHAQVARLFPATAQEVDLDPSDRWVLFHSLAFDYSVWEIWGAFYAGASLLLIPRSLTRDLAQFWQLLADEQVTALSLTPSALRALLPFLKKATQNPPLRWLILSGEKLETQLLKPWFAHFQDQVKVYNSYGITETTVFVSFAEVLPSDLQARGGSPIGHALADLGLCLMGNNQQPVPAGVAGEIWVRGAGLAQAYFENPELTAQRFIDSGSVRWYRSGDFARADLSGQLHYLKRRDTQFKIRGYRMEAAEIEKALLSLQEIQVVKVLLREWAGQTRLMAYWNGEPLEDKVLRERLKKRLPLPLIPEFFFRLEQWPLNQNGKLDLQALPLPTASFSEFQYALSTEVKLQSLLSELSGKALDPEHNFMDQGLHSLILVEAQHKIQSEFGIELALTDLFQFPNLHSLAQEIERRIRPVIQKQRLPEARTEHLSPEEPIAIIAMTGRFPGADSVAALWEMLKAGKTGLTEINREALRAQGLPNEELEDPNYVSVTGLLQDFKSFDPACFGLSASEARIMDPQQRLLLEQAFVTLEAAGDGHLEEKQSCGVFVSGGISRYLLFHLLQAQASHDPIQPMQVLLGNDKDYLATRIAYHLNLDGPALSIQTACSSSLVALHTACQSLRSQECEMALVGGVSLDPDPAGYLYQAGGIYSKDGNCHPFAEDASGIVGGSGVALVLLKPLSSALRDRDTVLAEIRGTALNNDAKDKAGFTAPGLSGQVQVLQACLQAAHLKPEAIRYLEAHGTGTALGDAIEVAALKQAWVSETNRKPWCAMGSVKANLGHLDAAAGIAGLIKAVLVLKHRQIPAQPNFSSPSSRIDWKNLPVYPASQFQDLPANETLFAAVSSFGIGGTNVHAILASAEPRAFQAPRRAPELLLFSARSEKQLHRLQKDLHDWTENQAEVNLQDLAYTLRQGRKHNTWRSFCVASDAVEAAEKLMAPLRTQAASDSPLIGLCPGLGSQGGALAAELCQSLPVFREKIDSALAELVSLDEPLAERIQCALLEGLPDSELARPTLMQPLIFLLTWAMGETWKTVGVKPAVYFGHSFGEYAALCLGGWVSFEALLPMVLRRAQYFENFKGFTWAVLTSAEKLQPLLTGDLKIAAYNGAEHLTVSGSDEWQEAFRSTLQAKGIRAIALKIPHLVHHPLLAEALEPFFEQMANLPYQQGHTPVLSSFSAQPLSLEDLSSKAYWRNQTLEPVQFYRAWKALLASGRVRTLEIGPGKSLSALIRSEAEAAWQSFNERGAYSAWLKSLGLLWQAGFRLNFNPIEASQSGRRIPVPGTPFEKQVYWVDSTPIQQPLQRRPLSDWFSGVSWRRVALPEAKPASNFHGLWLYAGPMLPKDALGETQALPQELGAWDCLSEKLGSAPQCLLDLRALTFEIESQVWQVIAGLQRLLKLPSLALIVLLPPVHSVTGTELQLFPEWALLLGFLRVLPKEYPGWKTTWIEVEAERIFSQANLLGLIQLRPEFYAIRGVWAWEPVLSPLETQPEQTLPAGAWLVSGARGEIGRALLAGVPSQASLVFIARSLSGLSSDDYQRFSSVEWVQGEIQTPETWALALEKIQSFALPFSGVILAAGEHQQVALAEISQEKLAPVLAKYRGTQYLLQALKKRRLKPERILLASALSSLEGQLGEGGYTLVHTALSALSEAAWNQGIALQAVHWGSWKEGGMAFRALAHLPSRLRVLQEKIVNLGIRRAEGPELLRRLWSVNAPQVVVSPLAPESLRAWGARVHENMGGSERESRPELAPAQLPQSELEQRLAEIWSQVLGVAPIGRDETWQSLGGDSLLALQIRDLLSSQWERSFPPSLLFSGTTISSLAEWIETEPGSSVLVKLNGQNQGLPFFCVHAISGTVFPFQGLAREFSSPFYALQAQGLCGKSPHTRIEAMAASYLEQVLQTQPSGSLWLGGWSFGALVAFEMARQALALGRSVHELVLVDMPLPPPGRVLAETEVRARFEMEMQKLKLESASAGSSFDLLYQVFEANLSAASHFQPVRLEIPACLLVAETGLAIQDPRVGAGWQTYLPQIQTLTLTGDHYSILESPGKEQLISALQARKA